MRRALKLVLGWAAILLGLVVLVSFNLLGWRMVAPVRAAAQPAGPCIEIAVASNGWHTDLVFPASILPDGHPLRRLYPDARTLSAGWGDRDAYRTGSEEPWRHAAALIPPRRSVLHIAADPNWDGRRIAISEAGAAGFANYLAGALKLDADRRAIFVSPGLVRGRSAFVEGRETFHLFRLCNHWTARALRAAGLPVSDLGAWPAESVTRQIGAGPRCRVSRNRAAAPN